MIINKDLYQQIVKVMPIPCVDLIVADDYGRVLLARRTNEPAKGDWWFFGGRVYYLETRKDAAVRKLKEECGLEAIQLDELSTFDVILDRSDNGYTSHAITTVFVAMVEADTIIKLDMQNSEAKWQSPQDWMKLELNTFIRQGLDAFISYNGSSTTQF